MSSLKILIPSALWQAWSVPATDPLGSSGALASLLLCLTFVTRAPGPRRGDFDALIARSSAYAPSIASSLGGAMTLP